MSSKGARPRSALESLQRWHQRVIKVMDNILFLLMTVMTVTVFLQVGSRYWLPTPVTWSEELAKFLLMWISYLGIASVFYYGKQIRIDLVDHFLPARVKKWVDLIVTDVAGLVFCIFFLNYLTQFMQRQLQFQQKSPVMGIPMYVTLIPFFLGAVIAGFHFLMRIISAGLEAGKERTG